MKTPYRIAIVGCGAISRAHANAWKHLPQIQLVGACDVRFEALSDFAKEFEINNTYKDLRTMLETQKPDILVITTWPKAHLKSILEGIRHNVKGILCENPITINAADAELIIQSTTRTEVRLMEALTYRYHPLTQAVKQYLLCEAIGEVRFARATFSSTIRDRTNWRFHGSLGGGVAGDLACYCTDLIRHLIDAEPQSVWACGKFDPIAATWDTLVGTLDFGDGITAQFDCSFGWDCRESYEVVGSSGTISVARAWNNHQGESSLQLNGKIVTISGLNPYAAAMENLCESISTGESTLLSLSNSLQNMRVIDSALEAAHTGKRIFIPRQPEAGDAQTTKKK